MAELEHAEGSMPSQIGPYRLARRLGRGGMGEVFLAWDERLGRRVAVKRILQETPRPQERERLRREARAAARLSHPAVVQVYDLVEDASGDAIVLEYVEGRTLRALLAEGAPPLGFALALAREIAEGLAAAHAAGLVHRDLKTENVVVTREGHAKILDFGIAKVPESETLTVQGVVMGTAHAMSPEQARGDEVDSRSDLFSLGILLYELLTGISPFRGSNSLNALQRVISFSPPSVSRLRPEVPRALSELVDRLLSKRPEGRPRSAGEVARTLAALAPPPAATLDVPEPLAETGSTLFDLPAAVAPAGAGRLSSTSTSVRSRRLPLALLLVLLTVLAASSAWLVQDLLKRGSPEPLRVAVLAPQAGSGKEDPGLVASGLLTATLSALASLEGLAPLDPAQAAPATTPVEAARTAAANEVIALGLERQEEKVRASLRRIGSDGRVLWTASFPVPAGSGDRDLRLLADAVAVQLRQAYPDRRLRPGVPELAVSDSAYAELLRIKDRIDRGSTDLEPELARLEAVVRDSPRFLEGHLLVADVVHTLFSSKHDPKILERGLAAARAAAELAPGDPRPLVARFRLALFAERLDEAEEVLAILSGLVPTDPQLHSLAGQLAETRGDLEGAVAELTAAVEGARSASNLYRLADLEIRVGRTAAARRHLEDLLARSPGHVWGLNRLAHLELLEGDPRRAEQLYLDIQRLQPHWNHSTNLGLARSLLGHHAEALEAYRHALELDPDNPYLLLNLADAELALDQEDEASEIYRHTLESLARIEERTDLSPLQRMIRAQCLAHLGRGREAVRWTQQALRESGDDPEILYAASLVYALAGDRASALVNAELALGKGMQPRWFTLPAFGPLRGDPELRALLHRRPESTPAAAR
ncbi:MAG TPA: protein kinase [Thermoanaerobaculia bacterium]|nr:protein kinase [Thermoanaerobaculia bacterium]